MSFNRHEIIEKNVGLLAVLIIALISLGSMTEIIPLMFQAQTTQPNVNLKPLTALQLEGRDIYIREGCNLCHSQMIRPFRAETERYGHYSLANESVYDHPFLWGSRRKGPDLARVGGRYSDEWLRQHFINPRDLVADSIMPSYPWFAKNKLSGDLSAKKLETFRKYFGVPYTDADIANAKKEVAGKTEMDAIIAYLQQLGSSLK